MAIDHWPTVNSHFHCLGWHCSCRHAELIPFLSSEVSLFLLQDCVMVGLHTCGDLASSTLRLFTAKPEIKAVCSVGCCYHLLSEECEFQKGMRVLFLKQFIQCTFVSHGFGFDYPQILGSWGWPNMDPREMRGAVIHHPFLPPKPEVSFEGVMILETFLRQWEHSFCHLHRCPWPVAFITQGTCCQYDLGQGRGTLINVFCSVNLVIES